ncbi:peroxiredoxin-like family protein [Aureivirga marina]|uniref:peroxiredoxin-like family protein n=1 Tax=Aureivirga marina TaxID=1182451 RepID=UPI0018CB0498|nr:peroxiredoxin-like family protein [Aureivirga marina]
MTLQESLAKLKAKIESGLPDEYIKIMHQTTKGLKDSGIENSILKVGDFSPEFTLPNQNNEKISLSDLLKKGPVIITFYRGTWCPYCNTDLNYLKRYKPEFDALNAHLISISPQIIKYNKQIVERHKLNFDVLSDLGNVVANKFGLTWQMKDPLKSLYTKTFDIQIPKYNGDDSWTLPIPARFIIGTDKIIKYVEYSIDYTNRPNPDVLVPTLKKL